MSKPGAVRPAMQYLELESHEASFNLALEEWLFANMRPESGGYFLLWQNAPSIIIGRHQVAAEVINRPLVEEKNIPVIRRASGGGAVYHDLGNLNFSFLESVAERQRIEFRRYLKPICAALGELGIAAEISGRNDLEANGKKISGSSQIVRAGKVLHHGTLLVSANLEAMASLLKVREDKFRSKGVASHKARVTNLKDIAAPGFSLEALKSGLTRHCASQKADLPVEAILGAEDLARKKYRTWEWNYGQSPKYGLKTRRRFSWGEITLHIQTAGDIISQCRISGDFFSSGDVDELAGRLKGQPFTREALEKTLAGIDWTYWFTGSDPDRMREFFLKDLFQ